MANPAPLFSWSPRLPLEDYNETSECQYTSFSPPTSYNPRSLDAPLDSDDSAYRSLQMSCMSPLFVTVLFGT